MAAEWTAAEWWGLQVNAPRCRCPGSRSASRPAAPASRCAARTHGVSPGGERPWGRRGRAGWRGGARCGRAQADPASARLAAAQHVFGGRGVDGAAGRHGRPDVAGRAHDAGHGEARRGRLVIDVRLDAAAHVVAVDLRGCGVAHAAAGVGPAHEARRGRQQAQAHVRPLFVLARARHLCVHHKLGQPQRREQAQTGPK